MNNKRLIKVSLHKKCIILFHLLRPMDNSHSNPSGSYFVLFFRSGKFGLVLVTWWIFFVEIHSNTSFVSIIYLASAKPTAFLSNHFKWWGFKALLLIWLMWRHGDSLIFLVKMVKYLFQQHRNFVHVIQPSSKEDPKQKKKKVLRIKIEKSICYGL